MFDVMGYSLFEVVEVTRTDPLEKLVWVNRRDSDDNRNKILSRAEDPHLA